MSRISDHITRVEVHLSDTNSHKSSRNGKRCVMEARLIFAGDEIQDLRVDERNRAKEIIEDFMIVANGATARFLHGKKVLSLRRMVRSPKRWDRIVEIAAQHNSQLPPEPDSMALASFLAAQKAADPLRFPDLSPVEGRLLHGYEGVDVGNRLKVQLIHTDVEKGYIDFKKS